MSALEEAQTTELLRDLGEHGTLRFKQTPRSRGYWLDRPDGKSQRMTSVTTVLGILAKPALLRWSEDWGARGTLAAVRMGELDPAVHHDEEAVGIVRALGLGADAAKTKAATRGLTVHDALEAWASDGDLPDPNEMDAEHQPYLRGLMNALLSLNPEPTEIEQVTCDPANGVGGRFDMVATIKGRRTMVDLKTSKRGRGYAEAHAQIAAYRACEISLGQEPCEHGIVLAVGPDGSFCADDQLATAESWEAILRCYRVMQNISRPLEAMQRADAKARKAAES